MNWIFYIILALIVFDFALGRVLSLLNTSYNSRPVPPEISDIYTEEKREKQLRYSNANLKLSWIINIFDLLVSLVMLFAGYRLLDGWIHSWTVGIGSELWRNVLMAVLFFCILMVAGTVVHWPFDLYSVFGVQKRFGFNRQTPRIFWTDQAKSILFSVLLNAMLLTIMVLVYSAVPHWFWLITWAVMTAISLFMSEFYSKLIVPLFNKQTPLPEGELRNAIEQFARETKFDLQEIYVLDSSKRSTHANAYFTGWGKHRRIVLYDTLIEQLTTDEVVAVLAHEAGHQKYHHIIKQITLSTLTNLLIYWLMGLTLQYNLCAGAIGCPASFHVNLYLFYILYEPLNVLLSLLSNACSRRYEYQADAFVREHGKAGALVSSLKKLSAHSLSNPTPHTAFVFFHYSHPTLVQRIRALQQ